MNFKRILSLILCLIMIVTCMLPLVACDDKDCEHIDEDGDGICDECEETMPACDSHIDTNNDGKCDNCQSAYTAPPAGKTNYTISVKTIGGMALEGITVYVYDGNSESPVSRAKSTDDSGTAVFELDTKSTYTITLEGVPEGYNVKDADNKDDRYKMEATGATILLSSKPVTEGGLKSNYNLGDVMYDFTLSDVKGNTYKLSEMLNTKKMVMLNFWYIDCSWCNKEFPGLNDSYDKYKDKMELLAINDYGDSLNEIIHFPTTGSYEEDNLVFPLCKTANDANSLTIDKFGGFAGNTGYPTTIIIDRYGVICMIEQGAIVGESKWNKIFDHFTSDNYEQKLVKDSADLTPREKPNVSFPGSDAIANNFNTSGISVTYSPDDNEYSWPFIPGSKDGVNYVVPSNSKVDNSYSILYANVSLLPGQAVIFDYFSSCEYASERLVVIVDGDDIYSITGVNKGTFTNMEDWEKCCAFVDPRPVGSSTEAITYEVAFTYIKDTENYDGDDTVYLKNLRVVSVDSDEIPEGTYIKRDAATNPFADGSGYGSYVNVEIGSDGYYYVVNPDGSKALLLANFLGYTNFDRNKTVSQRIMDVEKILVDGTDMYDYWMVFANASSNSAINGFVPVTETMKNILVAYCNEYRADVGKAANANLWLQLCIYYDAYGKDADGNPTEPLENPIIGLTTYTPFKVQEFTPVNSGDKITETIKYDRVIMPRGFLYEFVPTVSGVYRITSKSDQEVHGWVFKGDSLVWMASGTQEREVYVDFEQEERYTEHLYIDKDGDGVKETRDNNNVSLVEYFEAGEKYYIDIAYYDIYAEGEFTFDIMYEGESGKVFVMASPGPITYTEANGNQVGELIAKGIDYEFRKDPDNPSDETKYAYHVIKDEKGNVIEWGDKIYADLTYPTIPFTSQSMEQILLISGFNFSTNPLPIPENNTTPGKVILVEDMTAVMQGYIDKAKLNEGVLQGCTPVTEELANILHTLYSREVFRNVKNDWLKFSFYYKELAPSGGNQ